MNVSIGLEHKINKRRVGTLIKKTVWSFENNLQLPRPLQINSRVPPQIEGNTSSTK